MSIFTNWIFWVSLSAILFIFAMIGFLSDKKKKKEETSSVDSAVNKPDEILGNADASFSLDSPVQEEVKVSDVQPAVVVESGSLDTSGNALAGSASSLSGEQDLASLNNISLGENIQMSAGNSLTDTPALRNQVNVNTLDVNSINDTPDNSVNNMSSNVSNNMSNNVTNDLQNVPSELQTPVNTMYASNNNAVSSDLQGVSSELQPPANTPVTSNSNVMPNDLQGVNLSANGNVESTENIAQNGSNLGGVNTNAGVSQ